MTPEDLLSRIQQHITDADIDLEGEECNFSATVISPSFSSLSTLQRQQRVLAAASHWLATGELHALTVKAYTPEEWQNQQQRALVNLQL